MHKSIVKRLFFMFLILGWSLGVDAQSTNTIDEQGRKQGYWEKKDERGKIKYKGQFKDDIPYGKFKYYNEKGVVITVMNFISPDSAMATHYHENGKKSAVGLYVNRKKEGLWKFYDRKGILASTQEYKNGKKNGKLTVYNLNGSISRETFFVDDIENGYRKTYNSQGELLSEGMIKDGEPDGEQKWYRNGVINIKGFYKHSVPHGEWVYYDVEGKPYKTEKYELGVKIH